MAENEEIFHYVAILEGLTMRIRNNRSARRRSATNREKCAQRGV